MTYRSLDPDPEGIAQRVAAELGLTAAPSVRTNDEGRAIEVTIEDGDKTLTVNASGEWEYSDEGFAAEETGELISAEEFSERALAIANGGSRPLQNLPFRTCRPGCAPTPSAPARSAARSL